MPFDKHIIGQVPAVIRAAFNVSKLQKEAGTLGPRAIRFALTPWHLQDLEGAADIMQSVPETSFGGKQV